MKTSTLLVICACALVCSGILALGLKSVNKDERSVSVRGLCERTVDADMALWPLTFSLGSNNLQTLKSEVIEKTEVVKKYLADFGLGEEDYSINAPDIVDSNLDRYLDKSRIIYTYTARQVFFVRSKKVEAVKKAQEGIINLINNGLVIENTYGSKLDFEFVGLNDIKPEMIREATVNAKKAAEQFAADSGSKIGTIKKATQGLFTIENVAEGFQEKKTVRVVTNVEYLLK